MAVRERKDRGKWETYWRNPATGKRSCKLFDNRREAEKFDIKVKYDLEFKPEELLVSKKQKQLVDSKPCVDKELTFSEVVVKYFIYRRYTEKQISNWYKNTRVVLVKISNINVKSITKKMLVELYLQQVVTGISANTLRRRFNSIYSVLNFAENMEYIAHAPKHIKIESQTPKRFTPPTVDELQRLYSVAKPAFKRIIVLCGWLGMRVGPCEAFSLKWSDIDMYKNLINLRAAKKNKSEPIRIIPIPATFKQLFENWIVEDKKNGELGFVVHKKKNSERYLCSLRKANWKNTLKKAGIVNYFRPYDLRHAFATNMLENHADIGTVAKIMGHTSIIMVGKYYQHVSVRQKEKTLDLVAAPLDVQPVCPVCVSK